MHPSMEMDWAGLPSDMLIELVVRLTIADWLKFGAVCTTWRRAAETALHCRLRPRREPPWLMLAGDTADLTVADFLSFSDGRRRSISLPEPAIQKRAWIGSANGWLVTADEECTLHLLNPITGVQLPLPSVSTMGYFQLLPRTDQNNNAVRFLHYERSFLTLHWPDIHHGSVRQSFELSAEDFLVVFIRKAVPTWDPVSGEYLLMLIHGPFNKLAFARQSCRDAKWVILPSTYQYYDAILYRGQFYTVTRCGLVLTWEPDGMTFRPRLAAPKHTEDDEFVNFRKYLAESPDGNLMLIWRELSSDREEEEEEEDLHDALEEDDHDYEERLKKVHPTIRFQVFVLDERPGGSEWREVHDFGGATLFIGYNSAVFFPNVDQTPGLITDCIYFTDDRYDRHFCYREQKPRDMGLFHMKTKVVKPMPSFGQHLKNWPPPIWLTPSIHVNHVIR